MTDLEKIRDWLPSYHGWDAGGLLYIDYTDTVPGCRGLFPKGMEQITRQQDVLGGCTVRCRSRFALYRVAARQEDGAANAQWLLDFQAWVRDQSAAGLAPIFGDDPAGEHIRAEQGCLQKAGKNGTGIYAVTLTAEYVKKYPAQA